jgi:hypothetical protein
MYSISVEFVQPIFLRSTLYKIAVESRVEDWRIMASEGPVYDKEFLVRCFACVDCDLLVRIPIPG